jgi:RES domain-containing protein
MRWTGSRMAKPRTSLEPPESLQGTLIEWGGGKTLYRIHRQRFRANAFNPTPHGNARFSPILDRNGNIIPTLYAGTTLDCALMETVFHDVPYKTGFKPLPLSILEEQVHSAIEVKRNFRLLDLGTVALHKLGIKRSQLIDTTKALYPRTRRWAETFYQQFPAAQGLRWTSRQDDQAFALVLFGNRVKASDLVPDSEPVPLIENSEAILPVLELAIRLGVTFVS